MIFSTTFSYGPWYQSEKHVRMVNGMKSNENFVIYSRLLMFSWMRWNISRFYYVVYVLSFNLSFGRVDT